MFSATFLLVTPGFVVDDLVITSLPDRDDETEELERARLCMAFDERLVGFADSVWFVFHCFNLSLMLCCTGGISVLSII